MALVGASARASRWPSQGAVLALLQKLEDYSPQGCGLARDSQGALSAPDPNGGSPSVQREPRRKPRGRLITVLSASILIFSASIAEAVDPVDDFSQNCKSCHTIGGGAVTGPDLKDVSKRKDRAWLVRWILDPTGVLESGDPYAQEILKASRNVPMPPISGMTKARAESLLNLIEEESKKEKSRFAGIQISARPFTAADVEQGRRIFDGRQPLENGGPSCISCHTLGGLSALGGGRLGPDLTTVFGRAGYETRKSLGTWLSGPATITMLPTFRDHPMTEGEILPLIAYFKDAASTQVEDTAPRGLVFTLLGLGGAVGVVLLFNRLWRRRFRGVRQELVRASVVRATE